MKTFDLLLALLEAQLESPASAKAFGEKAKLRCDLAIQRSLEESLRAGAIQDGGASLTYARDMVRHIRLSMAEYCNLHPALVIASIDHPEAARSIFQATLRALLAEIQAFSILCREETEETMKKAQEK